MYLHEHLAISGNLATMPKGIAIWNITSVFAAWSLVLNKPVNPELIYNNMSTPPWAPPNPPTHKNSTANTVQISSGQKQMIVLVILIYNRCLFWTVTAAQLYQLNLSSNIDWFTIDSLIWKFDSKTQLWGIVITYLCKAVYPQCASLTQGINPFTKLIK